MKYEVEIKWMRVPLELSLTFLRSAKRSPHIGQRQAVFLRSGKDNDIVPD